MTTPITLNDLPIGKTATVRTVGGQGALRQHFLDMGLIPNAAVTMVKRAPMGDPIEVRIKAYELTLRAAEAPKLKSRTCETKHPPSSRTFRPTAPTFSTRVSAKAGSITSSRMKIPSPKEPNLRSFSRGIRTAGRRRSSTV